MSIVRLFLAVNISPYQGATSETDFSYCANDELSCSTAGWKKTQRFMSTEFGQYCCIYSPSESYFLRGHVKVRRLVLQ
jgi:hypothetical protein